jgi:peptidoglycan/xylan/chitin deacetylase (PgdA/CDA1 family)
VTEHPHPEKRTVYLTFDDGPYPATEEVLDVLREQKVRATFFLCAKHLESRADIQFRLIKRMLSEGHSLGNHGYDHDPSKKSAYLATTTEAVKKDFVDNVDKLRTLCSHRGLPFPAFQVARLPGAGGTFPQYREMVTRQLGIPHASWDFEFATNGKLGHVSHQNWQGILGVSGERAGLPAPNDILLLHDLHWGGKRGLLAALIAKLRESCTLLPLVPVPRGHRRIQYP